MTLPAVLLHSTFRLCGACAWLIAPWHALALFLHLAKGSPWLRVAETVDLAGLHSIWSAGLVREVIAGVLRTRHAPMLYDLIDLTGTPLQSSDGLVLAICHTPWGRLLAYLSRRHRSFLLVGGGRWPGRMATMDLHPGASGIRALVEQLQAGGKVFAVSDAFGGSAALATSFLGQPIRAPMFAARLAALAGVPMVPVVFRWANGGIKAEFGRVRRVEGQRADFAAATQEMLTFFEDAILRDPATWKFTFKPCSSAGA